MVSRSDKERSDVEKIRHRLMILWYQGAGATFYGCWALPKNELKTKFKWVLDEKYKLLDNKSTRGIV